MRFENEGRFGMRFEGRMMVYLDFKYLLIIDLMVGRDLGIGFMWFVVFYLKISSVILLGVGLCFIFV